MFEVEMKFRVADPQAVEERLSRYGVVPAAAVEELDRFYQHPARDFVETDEGLRIRRRRFPDNGQHVGEEVFLTYKGPKIDTTTKTRREIEIPLHAVEPWNEMLEALGFRPAGVVRKFRRRGELLIRDRRFGILLDTLPDLEKRTGHGTFVELETLAEEHDLADARRALLELAAMLELEHSIRTSYLGLLTNTED